MYKILIADDEIWIRKNLEKMISWEEYGLEFLEPAVDGEDVLNKIEENRPDILITDINMPFINGVRLLNILSEKYPEIVTFVVSGYDNFEYVKSTLLAGAINYLLKPVTKIDLVSALSKALNIIAQRQEQKEKEENQSIKLMKASSMMQDYEYSKLLEKEEASFAPSIGFCETESFNGMYLVLMKIHNLKKVANNNGYDKNQISYHVKKEIEKSFETDAIIFNNVYRSNEFLVITRRTEKELKSMADIMVMKFSQMYASPITVCIGKRVYSMESIHMAYVEDISLLMIRRYNEENEVLMQQNMKNEEFIGSFVNLENEMKIKRYLENFNKRMLEQMIFDEMGFGTEKIRNRTYLEVKQNVKKVLTLLADYQTICQTPQEITDLNNLIMLSDRVVDSLDRLELREVIQDVINFVIQNENIKSNSPVRSIIKQAVRYIDKTYFEELTLFSLSQKYGVESSYFSKLFRNETGKNLILYIAEKRIEKAKEYIKQDEVKLTEIAFLVGYEDYSYFNRVFRKITGQSPRSYKQSVAQSK